MFDFRYLEDEETNPEPSKPIDIVFPGTVVTSDPSFMRGRGTWLNAKKQICSSVVGRVEPINKLISVRPQKFRYYGQIGDVVVGRVIEVQHKRFIIDVNARLNAVLLMSSINLPTGELRRKTEEDQCLMKAYLDVGTLISAEVNYLFADGSLSLHTRSMKFGKLSQGLLVKVPASLIRRQKTHFHNHITGVHLILSDNGYIWIAPQCEIQEENRSWNDRFHYISIADRENIVRIRNCILALRKHNKMICDTSILFAFEASFAYEAQEILKPHVIKNIVDIVKQRFKTGKH